MKKGQFWQQIPDLYEKFGPGAVAITMFVLEANCDDPSDYPSIEYTKDGTDFFLRGTGGLTNVMKKHADNFSEKFHEWRKGL